MRARRVLRESNETLKEGYGFDNQREDCLKCEGKHGLEVVKEDNLVETSSSWNREKFQKIIDEVIQEREEITVVVFSRVDRFARNLAAAGYYLGLLRQNGLTVVFAQEDLVVDNEASVMTVLMFFIHSFKADQDGKQIKHNALGGRDKLATEAGEIPNGMVIWPFDYMAKRNYGQMSTGRPSINKERANWVKKWANSLQDGDGLAEICRKMNDDLVLTPSAAKGRKNPARIWSSKAIRDILLSRQLIGEFWWKGTCYLKDEDLRILIDEQFEAIQRRLDENRERSFYNATKYDYPPLRKMVFCGYHTNQIMYGKPSGRTLWYYCPVCKKEDRRNEIRSRVLWEGYKRGIEDKLMAEERLIPAMKAQFENEDAKDSIEHEIRKKGDEIKGCEGKKDAAFRLGMSIKDYPPERVQGHIDVVEHKIRCLKTERADLEKKLGVLREQTLNEEGIKRLCKVVARNIGRLTKNQWEVFNKLLRLRITVFGKESVVVNVALPPILETRDFETELSHL